MALSRTRLCGGSAVMLLYGIRPAGVTAGCCTLTLVSRKLRLGGQLSGLQQSYSTRDQQSLRERVGSRLKWANEKYESFLQNNFPRFYLLYHTFMTGAKLLFRDAKEMKRIRVKMMRQSQSLQQLPYREVEALRQFRRDVIKAAPMVLISIPPFANYLVFILMYLFPRQLLIRHFWTPQQQMEFQQIYHRQRAQHHAGVLRGLTMAVSNITEKPLQRQLLQLCNKIERGAHPSVSQIHAVRRLFVGPPLGIKRLKAAHMRSLSCQLFLTPRLPAFLIRHRLWGHASELLQLDRALSKLGLHQLSDQELRQACYLRGLDSTRLDVDHCKEWLYNWLQLSTRLKDSEVSLLLHSMVLLSLNYPTAAVH